MSKEIERNLLNTQVSRVKCLLALIYFFSLSSRIIPSTWLCPVRMLKVINSDDNDNSNKIMANIIIIELRIYK